MFVCSFFDINKIRSWVAHVLISVMLGKNGKDGYFTYVDFLASYFKHSIPHTGFSALRLKLVGPRVEKHTVDLSAL